MPLISIIIPCYFNEENIPVTSLRLIENENLFPTETDFEYVMVDDGSKDKTFEALVKFHGEYPDKVRVIKLAGNVGSYNAILAGMNHSKGDCMAVITADLQDPVELIPKMYDYWLKGIKLVVASRLDREESFFSKTFSNLYHFLIRKIALKNIPHGGFDFVLFDKQLKEEVIKINEKNTNTLYLLPWLGFDHVNIPYKRKKRELGKSMWTFQKKLKLFIDSFVSFTYFPIRFISAIGILLGLISFIYLMYVLYAKISGLINIEGWTTLMVVFLIVSSFQMLALGILGEYIWRILDAARKRPNFVVDKIIETGKI